MNASTTPSSSWKSAVLEYASHLNDYIARGDACQWKGMGKPKDPPDLAPLLPELLGHLRTANATGDEAAVARVRAEWPPLHEAVASLLDTHGQGFSALAWLPANDADSHAEADLLVRTGAWYQPGATLRIHGLDVTPVPEVRMFGTSPDRRLLALADEHGIRVVRSAGLAPVTALPLPKGDEGLPPGIPAPDAGAGAGDGGGEAIQQLIPFNDASAVVVVRSAGIFLVSQAGIQRLLPTAEELQEQLQDDDEPYPVRLDMCHAAVSPDGQWIACGQQDGGHRIFNARGELVDTVGPHGEYPHHAAFFADGRHVALNACHFYNGGTIAVQTQAFGSIDTDHYDEHPAVTPIDASARVYASAPTGDALVLGDAHGYLWVRNPAGELQWKQHLGSTISAMEASADGRLLAVGSYSGTVHIIDLADAQAHPEQVGTHPRRELRRWLFWKPEERPLAW